jgi:plastocyanin
MAINKIPGEALHDDAITSDHISDNSIPIEKLGDVDTTTVPPTTGDALVWDGTNFIPLAPFSQSDFDTAFSSKDTDDLSEGSTNLFYTDARVDARISQSSGDFVLPKGTTAQRPVSPTVGMLRYNTDTSTVEKYTGTGWYSLNTFPTITNTSYASGADATDPSGGELVTITGTNFEIGSTLLLDSTSVSYSVVSDTQITFTAPTKTAGDYDLVLVSPQGAQATSLNAISYNGVPTWTTTAGSLGSFNEGDSVSISLVASEPDAGAITYTIVSGSLPSGLSLSGNIISGTAPSELSDTSYPFTIRATDNENQFTDRSFTITTIASATYAVEPSGATAYTADVTSSGSSAYTFSNATDRDGAVSGSNDSINILAGDTITITNNAGGSHPIYFKTVQGTGTGNLVTGATGQGAANGADISWTPTVPGTYYYQCSNHGSMNGTIVVQATDAVEGSAFTFDVATTNVPDSTTLYWTIENVTTADADFSSTSGSFTVTSNSSSFTVTPIDESSVDTGELFYVRVRTASTSGTVVAESAQVQVIDPVGAGEHVYTTAGTHQWTCPAGVTSVSVVCVGTGGMPSGYQASGAGGGLGYKNTISVTPGQSYTVVVGARGTYGSFPGNSGGDSYFINNTTVKGGGGEGGSSSDWRVPSTGGDYVGDGGGEGGGSPAQTSWFSYSGNGGAGGYSGNGGDGGLPTNSQTASTQGTAGNGGGGGGGSGGRPVTGGGWGGGNGGGVGIYGQGANGAAGPSAPTGSSSSSGVDGSPGSGGSSQQYGGAGGGSSSTVGLGAVRIIWGGGRSFPLTNTDEASSDGNITTN